MAALKKLTIQAYKSSKFESGDEVKGATFKAMFNPTTLTRKIEFDVAENQGSGTSSAEVQFNKIKPQDYTFELLIDGTGASAPKPENGVKGEIDKFMEVCVDYIGEIHRPYYAMISYGNFILKSTIKSADITYTMFDAEGVPIRAKISATFTGTVDDDLRIKKDKPSSPDLTHERIVKEGDTLPLMAYSIYKDSKYYIQVAKANGIKNPRQLTPGQKLYFPPIKK